MGLGKSLKDWSGSMISTYPLPFAGNEISQQHVIRNFDWLFPILNRTIITGQNFSGEGYRAFTAPFTGDAVLILTKK